MTIEAEDETYLELIEEARSRNNINWMCILRIAMKHAPLETRAVLKSVRAIDMDIHYYTKMLANEDRQ